jgi:very-short-patch-repair endonuclease
LTSEDHLHRRIGALRSSGRHGVPRLVQLLEEREIRGNTQSWLEREYLRLLRSACLPTPTAQVVLGRRGNTLIRVDFHFPGTAVVVEVLGYRWHRTTAQMSIDAERVTRLTLDGKVVVQFTYHQVTTDPGYVLATTAEALDVASWSAQRAS